MEKRPSKGPEPSPLYSSAFMAEYVFRGLRKQGVTSSDSQAMKQYYNLHQDEIKKEVESLSKKASDQALRTQYISRLERKASVVKDTLKNFTELERFVETTLQLGDKDAKKFVMFNIILASAKSLTDISLQPLADLLKTEGGDHKVNKARSSPPPTDIKDLKYEMPKSPPKKASVVSPQEPEYEEEEFEKVTEREKEQPKKEESSPAKRQPDPAPADDYEEDYENDGDLKDEQTI